MELTDKEIKKLQDMPIIENKVSKSKDGKTIIIRTIITKLYSINYFKKVLDSKGNNGNIDITEEKIEN